MNNQLTFAQVRSRPAPLWASKRRAEIPGGKSQRAHAALSSSLMDSFHLFPRASSAAGDNLSSLAGR